MKVVRNVCYFLGMLVCAVLLSCIYPTPSAEATTRTRLEIEKNIEQRINTHRESLGLEPLTRKKKIVRVAREHSVNMATEVVPFGHTGFAERFDALQTFFDHLAGAGENVAYTSSDTKVAKQFVDMWLASAGHRANIENPSYNVSGVGVKFYNGRYYATHVFLSQR